MTYVVLLRAINVGGHNSIAMGALRSTLEHAGYAEVRTLLQSGNVVLGAPSQAADVLERALETLVSEHLSVDIAVIVRDLRQWRAIIDANPFVDEATSDPSHLLVMPMKTAPTSDGIDSLRAAIAGRERVEVGGSELYIVYPDGVGRTKLTNALIEKKLGAIGTARNWNTVLKIAALAGV